MRKSRLNRRISDYMQNTNLFHSVIGIRNSVDGMRLQGANVETGRQEDWKDGWFYCFHHSFMLPLYLSSVDLVQKISYFVFTEEIGYRPIRPSAVLLGAIRFDAVMRFP